MRFIGKAAIALAILSLTALAPAHALAEDCTLVTADRAFTQVPGLKVDDWTVS